ncbi:uncharacterized protein LY79DRAFT_595331 [Colletotrichum navitas]|uniref:Uncharacterized protein n=1 Tax=Colletotrichum navitas TaxID=681940 RepID=A0AAD8PIZ5_9PEZI|nr:uncharacterized protein LY79DRAFT_595331 [Colletotrichum navitas]KAK1564126.1 hypothetical protein LY79DRAFT_595331 [Colletotrichum navitas]
MAQLTSTKIHKVMIVGKGYIRGYVYNKLVNASFEVIPHQYKLINAASAADTVKHFIPSDFTALSVSPELTNLPFYRDAVAICLIVSCVLNGNKNSHKVGMMQGYTMSKAVALVLSKSKEIKSRLIFIHDSKEILWIAEEKPGVKWSVSHVDPETKLQDRLHMFEGPPIFTTFLIIHSTIFGSKYKTNRDGEGNKTLSIPLLEDLILQRVSNTPIDGGLLWNSGPKPRNQMFIAAHRDF